MKIAYLSLQQVAQGLDTWAAVNEVICGLEEEGVEVDTYFPSYKVSAVPTPYIRLGEMWRIQRRLIRSLSTYDAIYIRSHPLAAYASRMAARAGIPVVQECNGTIEDLYVAWPITRHVGSVFERLQSSQYASASYTICVTPELAEWVHRVSGSSRTVVVPNGVNTDVFCDRASAFPGLPQDYAVFFGNFAPWQGINVLIAAFDDPAWPQDLPLVFAGHGVMQPNVERARDDHPGQVFYIGHVPYESMSSVVANARLSVVPIYSPEREDAGFSPLKLYESMACGTPVVAAATGGLEEIVKRYECGVPFAVGDAHALAVAVAELHGSPERRETAGRNARKAALEECSWRARASARAVVLREVVGM